MKRRCIYWLKRDFRLTDNPALTAALNEHEEVVPLFVLEPSAIKASETSSFHLHGQCDAFNALYHSLHRRSRPLCFAFAEVIDCLDSLYNKAPFDCLVSHLETGNNRTYERDKAVTRWCSEKGVQWKEYRQTGVFRGPIDRDQRHHDWEKFYQQPLLPAPKDLSPIVCPQEYQGIIKHTFEHPFEWRERKGDAEDIWFPQQELFGKITAGPLRPEDFGMPLSEEQKKYVQPVSEQAAETTLRSFATKRAINYSKGMSSPNLAFYHCSRLSVHFAWGTISARNVYQRVNTWIKRLGMENAPDAGTWRRNLRSFLSRLHWRDHFTQRLETEVEMEHRALNPNFWELELENAPEMLAAWTQGRTGYPMVDACIRCLKTTGYINFRMRSMLTSTATHIMHLDFRAIDKPMARLYTDYEPGIHLSQLQMQAGMVGINTLRTYSPEKQMLDHDPEATFIHRWVPELRPYSAADILGRDHSLGLGEYPPVIVERKERITTYREKLNALKFRPGGKEITEKVFQKHGSRKRPGKSRQAESKKRGKASGGVRPGHTLPLWPADKQASGG